MTKARATARRYQAGEAATNQIGPSGKVSEHKEVRSYEIPTPVPETPVVRPTWQRKTEGEGRWRRETGPDYAEDTRRVREGLKQKTPEFRQA